MKITIPKLKLKNTIIPNYTTSHLISLTEHCTASCFGHSPIPQNVYYCLRCDSKQNYKLCEGCYNECHGQCQDEDSPHIKILNEVFVCDCFSIFRHGVNTLEEIKKFKCTLLSWDMELLPKKYFVCKDDKLMLCSYCYWICHRECINRKKVIVSNINTCPKSTACQCKHINHSSNDNEFLFKFSLRKYSQEMQLNILPVQFVNLIFGFDNIFTCFINDIGNSENIAFHSDLIMNFCVVLNRKIKIYYFNDTISRSFNWKRMFKEVKNIIGTSKQEIQLKVSLLHVTLNVNVKVLCNSNHKSWSSNDFLSNDIITRWIYRLKVRKNIEIVLLLSEASSWLFDDWFPYFEKWFDKEHDFWKDYSQEFEYLLEFVNFILKQHYLTWSQIQQLIQSLEILHNKLMHQMEEVEDSLNMFNYFFEIFYIISIEYNDLVVENKINGIASHFVHYDNKYGDKWLQMIAKSNNIICQHYTSLNNEIKHVKTSSALSLIQEIEKTKKKRKTINENLSRIKTPERGIIIDKHIKFYNESIKLFTISNNLYANQWNVFSDEYLKFYGRFKGYTAPEINKFRTWREEINNKLKELFLHHVPDGDKIILISTIKTIIDAFMNNYEKLNQSKESNYNHERSKSDSSSNNRSDNDNSSNSNHDKKKKNNPVQSSTQLNNTPNASNAPSCLPDKVTDKKLNFYVQKIIDYNKYQNPSFIQVISQSINSITYDWIISNLDDLLCKLLVYLSLPDCQIITFELLETCLSWISIYFLSKESMKFFLTGKNFINLNKVFHYLCINKTTAKNYNITYWNHIRWLLEFYNVMVQGIWIYEIKISNSKILPRLIKNLIIYHWYEFYTLQEFDTRIQMEFKLHLNLITKLFLLLYSFYDNEEFMKIKIRLWQIFNQIIDKDNFFSYFTRQLRVDNSKISQQRNRNGIRKGVSNANKTKNMKKRSIRVNPTNQSQLMIPLKEQVDIEMIFAFFDLFSKGTFCINHRIYPELEKVITFFDYTNKNIHPNVDSDNNSYNLSPNKAQFEDNMIWYLFQNENFTLNERLIILKFLRTICFIERTHYNNVNDIKHSLTTKEFLAYHKTQIKDEFPTIVFSEEETKEDARELSIQYKRINNIILLINWYINEWKSLDDFFTLSKDIDQYLKTKYITELIFGVKTIADFFYWEKEIWNQPITYFYSLTCKFLAKTTTIIRLLKEDSTYQVSISLCKKWLKEIEEKQFDIYNIKVLYKIVSENTDFIYSHTKINKKYSLEKFFRDYDLLQESNFVPNSLVEEKDYEYFYEQKNAKNNGEKTMIHPYYQGYINEFIDINNTCLLSVIKGIKNDKVNYRKIFVDYFKIYINSGIQDLNFDSLLLIITKVFFYDTQEMRSLISQVVIGPFFTNFKKKLQKNSYQIYITSKNIYITGHCWNVYHLSRLMIIFLQLIGSAASETFEKINSCDKEKTLFEDVVTTLQWSISWLDYETDINAELPYDKLIIHVSNLFDFLNEYLTNNENCSPAIEDGIDRLIFNKPNWISVLKNELIISILDHIVIKSFYDSK